MPDFLLDTQTIRYWFDDSSPFHNAVRQATDALPAASHVCVSAITLGEIKFGVALNVAGMHGRLDDYWRFVRDKLPRILPVSRHTAEPYGAVRATLFERFAPKANRSKTRRAEQLVDPATGRELGIDENDLWLVAQAIERNLVLVTSDRMTRLRAALQDAQPGLSLENWAAD